MVYKIKMNELSAAAVAAQGTLRRYYMHGVFCECYGSGQVGLIATDGHRLHAINTTSDKIKESFILGLPQIKKLEKLYKTFLADVPKILRDTARLNMDVIDKGEIRTWFSVADGDEQYIYAAIKPIDGNFPDWRKVIPKEPSKEWHPIYINEKLLNGFLHAAKLLGLSAFIKLDSGGGVAAPIRVTIDKAKNFVGVIMPIRAWD
jgi:DNA polymerase III sliding clamp (beta) subunit (PCNA family)